MCRNPRRDREISGAPQLLPAVMRGEQMSTHGVHGVAARLTVSLPGMERQVASALVEAADQVREQKRQILVAHMSVGLVWLV